METAQRVAKNSLMIFLSSVSTKILSLIFVIAVTRYLGDAGFGKYSFVFAWVSIFVIFTAFGIDTVVIRDVAKDASRRNDFFASSVALKSLFSLTSWALLFLAALILKKGPVINLGIMLIGFCLLPDSITGSFKAIFSAHERMEFNTLLEIFFRLVIVVIGLAVIRAKLGLISIFFTSICASMVTVSLAAFIYVRVFGAIQMKLDYKLCKYLLTTSVSFFLAGIFVSLYHQIDVVFLSVIKGDAPVGWYNAARQITYSLLFIPAALCGAIFPVFSKIHLHSKESFEFAYRFSYKVLLVLALPLASGITILGDRIILLIYKTNFIHSIIVLKILAWAMAFAFLNIVMSIALYSVNKERIIVLIVSIMALLSVFLNLFFIPQYGYIASSVIAVVTELVGFILCSYLVPRYVCRIRVGSVFLKSVFATAIMVLFITVFRNSNLAFLTITSCVLYASIIMMVDCFSAEEKRSFKRILQYKRSA